MASESYMTSETVAARIGDALTGLFGEASPSTLFSEPIQHGDDLVVTAVAWERAGGFGFGAGQGQGQGEESGSGEGGGGGGFSQGRPVAVIRVTPTGGGGDAGDRLHQDRRHAAPGIARGLASPQPLRSSPPLAAQD